MYTLYIRYNIRFFHNDIKGNNPVIDLSKLFDFASINESNSHAENTTTTSAETIEEFIEEFSSSISQNISASVEIGSLSANISKGFGVSASETIKTYSNSYFLHTSSYKEYKSFVILDWGDTKLLSNILSDHMRSIIDSNSLSNEEKARMILDIYGTHLLMGIKTGGSLDYYYSIATNDSSVSTQFSSYVNQNATLGGLSVDGVTIGASNKIGMSTTLKNSINNHQTEIFETLKIYGGESTGTYDTNIESDRSFSWNLNDSNARSIGITGEGAIPLYKIISHIDPNLAVALKDLVEKESALYDSNVVGMFMRDTTTIPTTSISCKKDNGYNHTNPDENANNKHFSHEFELGKFYLSNCYKSNNSYFITQTSGTDLYFHMNYDAAALPTQNQDNMTARYICNDSYSGTLYNMPFDVGSQSVGYGLLVVKIVYYDGTEETHICKKDFLKEAKADEKLFICTVTKPCTVSIALCYEVEMWGPGSFLPISDNYWMNWKIIQKLEFEQAPYLT